MALAVLLLQLRPRHGVGVHDLHGSPSATRSRQPRQGTRHPSRAQSRDLTPRLTTTICCNGFGSLPNSTSSDSPAVVVQTIGCGRNPI
jgi:hypothetical protein